MVCPGGILNTILSVLVSSVSYALKCKEPQTEVEMVLWYYGIMDLLLYP